MLWRFLGKALLAMALFSGAALVLVFLQKDPADLVSSFVTFPLLIAVASVVTIIAYAIAAVAARFAGRSSLAAAGISAALGWLFASGGYQSFGGLGAYSDLIQPAYAVALAAPWLIQAWRASQNTSNPPTH